MIKGVLEALALAITDFMSTPRRPAPCHVVYSTGMFVEKGLQQETGLGSFVRFVNVDIDLERFNPQGLHIGPYAAVPSLMGVEWTYRLPDGIEDFFRIAAKLTLALHRHEFNFNMVLRDQYGKMPIAVEVSSAGPTSLSVFDFEGFDKETEVPTLQFELEVRFVNISARLEVPYNEEIGWSLHTYEGEYKDEDGEMQPIEGELLDEGTVEGLEYPDDDDEEDADGNPVEGGARERNRVSTPVVEDKPDEEMTDAEKKRQGRSQFH